MEDMFSERTSPTTIVAFIEAFAREYRKTERLLVARMVESPWLRISESYG
jgi:hypothetical protein